MKHPVSLQYKSMMLLCVVVEVGGSFVGDEFSQSAGSNWACGAILDILMHRVYYKVEIQLCWMISMFCTQEFNLRWGDLYCPFGVGSFPL